MMSGWRAASRRCQHAHCTSCYSRRCRAPVEAGVCCQLVSCRLHCGALFHLCKEEGHLLLCPNVNVPCLNAAYGCPAHLRRSQQATHLQACPASVVVCSVEWNRWPADHTDPHCPRCLQENVLKENEGQGEALDVAMALVDQEDLFARLKMKPLFPELMDPQEQQEEIQVDATRQMIDSPNVHEGFLTEEDRTCENVVTMETDGGEAGGSLVVNKEKLKLSEMMFGMDKGGCALAEAKQIQSEPNSRPLQKDLVCKVDGGPEAGGKKMSVDIKEDAAGAGTFTPPDTSKTGLAPWQDGVLERLGQELSPHEYNMYVVHHGRMLIAFGQIEACTPRDKDFVYGNLEPIPVQTLRSFKVPDSYHYRRRVHLYDTAARALSETRSVDTSELQVSEEDFFSDEAVDTLLGYAEKEVRGHKISESKVADGLYVDEGTQTYFFRSAPFKRDTTLAEVTSGRPLKLYLRLQDESVSGRHNRTCCVFNFLCGHSFLRREFSSHVKNVHADIQSCLSGWFEQRCPLAYLGCTYTWRRFRPANHDASVTYNRHLRSFNLRPMDQPSAPTAGEVSSLSSLPYEVLCHMASFLDSLSLSQLALVSRLMRQVCSSLLPSRGMVTLHWQRKSGPRGGVRWTAEPVWEFSRLFSSVDSWRMMNEPPMSAHLKVCPFYETTLPGQPVPLLSLTEEHLGLQTPSLVKHFTSLRS
ncbi:F-box only protein 40-like [Dunckerocampus dactyliophorus]|uniref:F-box only protein 40-like n=1 Tax=Dunckerocampus dactyliophorus TaxID=161453 RepID=UPI002406AE7A|nr:F-box only protein 40-like [Dunckerocampus dactyliophorus]XP_054610410.1 F-box only protein 40-like [Dunckerocampus dactyliophorus]XP_054610411.1 F-box only protein 40-like [Dunckerocampus dactyliophorus]XP_054610412.1 F-box only protein 40-like [Dunckerocampus dactyliophorus]XP_054610413.1 F-box only protein 40-like [Dunckerocampus dactyliophorus]XP_054610414.1 F-box only protein 40-like [Dunckerocampus dactyliophorus]XP_054610415.1 F-box only protein 40-like [Dunckerocampus dactyliophoru